MKHNLWKRIAALLLAAIMVMTGTMSVWAADVSAYDEDDWSQYWSGSDCFFVSLVRQNVQIEDGRCSIRLQGNIIHEANDEHMCNQQFLIFSFSQPLPIGIEIYCNDIQGEVNDDRTMVRFLNYNYQNSNDHIGLGDFELLFNFGGFFSETELQEFMSNMQIIDLSVNDYGFRVGGNGEGTDPYDPQDSYYQIVLNQSDGGTISADKDEAMEGETVTITAEPNDEMKLSGIYLDDEGIEVTLNSDGTYSFNMPGYDVNVTAEWESVVSEDENGWEGSDCYLVSWMEQHQIETGRISYDLQLDVTHNSTDGHSNTGQYLIFYFSSPLPANIQSAFVNEFAAEIKDTRDAIRIINPVYTGSESSLGFANIHIDLNFDGDTEPGLLENIYLVNVAANDKPFRVYNEDPIITPTPCDITEQPQSCEHALGERVNLSVAATGEDLTYQWQYLKPGATKWVNSGLSSAKSSELTFKMSAGYDGMQFRCKVTDYEGTEVYSEPATSTLVEWITITQQPVNTEAGTGKKATFSVEAVGDGLTYQWQYQKPDKAKWYNSTSTGHNTDTLKVSATAGTDGMKFRCVVTDAAGHMITSDSAILTTIPAPEIIEQPESVWAAVGRSVKLTVSATGTDLTYQWQYQKPGTTSWKKSGLSSATRPTLSFKTSAAYDGMKFRCKVTDAYGVSVFTDEVLITVVDGPTIVKQPEDAIALFGTKATFSVETSGEGLSYQWQYQKVGKTTWTNSTSVGNKTESVSVSATTGTNGMKFRCVVTDMYGNVVTSDGATLGAVDELPEIDEDDRWLVSDCYSTSWEVRQFVETGRTIISLQVNALHDSQEFNNHNCYNEFLIIYFEQPLPAMCYNITVNGTEAEIKEDRTAMRVLANWHCNAWDNIAGDFTIEFELIDGYSPEEFLSNVQIAHAGFNDIEYRYPI